MHAHSILPALQPMTDEDRQTADQLEARELARDFAANEAANTLPANDAPGGLTWVRLSAVTSKPQSRTENGFDAESLGELAESIQARGLLQPPVLQREADGTFSTIAGHRRIAACRILQLEFIPAMVGQMATAHDQVMAQLAENVHRLDMTTADTAKAVRTLHDSTGQDVEQTARLMGKSKAWVCKHLAVTTTDFSWTARNLLETGRVTDLELLHGLNQLDKLHSPKLADAIKRAQLGNLKRDDLRKWVAEAKDAKREAERQKRQRKAAAAAAPAPAPVAPRVTWHDLIGRVELRGDDLAACMSVVDELEDADTERLTADILPSYEAGQKARKATREDTARKLAAWVSARYASPWMLGAWIAGSTADKLNLSDVLHTARRIATDED